MKNLFSLAATAALMMSAAGTATAEPTYQAKGVPITLYQVGVLGSVLRIVDMQESAATPTLMSAGLPASPHQVAVLVPPAEQQIAARPPAD